MSMMLTPRLAWLVLALSLAAYGLTLLPGPWVPRFSVDALNYWFAGLASFGVPLALLLMGVALKGVWRKGVAFALAALLGFPLGLFGVFALLEAENATASFKPLDELAVGHLAYRLYRTDCGATCAFGLVLRQELELLPGLKLVSQEWSVYREDAASLRLSPEGRVQVVKGEFVMHSVGEP